MSVILAPGVAIAKPRKGNKAEAEPVPENQVPETAEAEPEAEPAAEPVKTTKKK